MAALSERAVEGFSIDVLLCSLERIGCEESPATLGVRDGRRKAPVRLRGVDGIGSRIWLGSTATNSETNDLVAMASSSCMS